MRIEDLTYFDDDGHQATYGSADDPYGGRATPLANALFNVPALHLRWTCVDTAGTGHEVVQRFSGSCRAVVTPGRCFVAVWTSDPRYPVPCNGVIFNADGSVRYIVCPPAEVEHQFPEYDSYGKVRSPGKVRPYPAEMLDGVELRDDKIVYPVNFAYEWNQLRVFDPEQGTWGEVIGAYPALIAALATTLAHCPRPGASAGEMESTVKPGLPILATHLPPRLPVKKVF